MIARLAPVVALGVCLATPAHAGPLAEALARGDDAAIAALRARRDEVGARCTLGAIYARRGELARAGFFLDGCDQAALPEDIAGTVGKIAGDTLRWLDGGDLASIQVLSAPASVHVPAESDALPGEPFTTPAMLWVRPGSYEVRARVNGAIRTSTVVAEAHKRATVVIEVPAEKAPQPHEQVVTIEEEALGEQETAPPPGVKHPTLLPKKYRGEEEGEGGPKLIDPLAMTAAARPPRAHWLGARLAGGMFDDGHAAARAGVGVAAAGRYALSTRPSGGPAVFLAGRLDWTRRGGVPDMSGMDTGARIDVLGAGAGAGLTVLDRGALAIALIGQLRADLRLASARGDEPVRRAGLGAAAGAELALPGSPITAGLRFEHGLTELVAGARDRAVLLEIGVDWR